MSVEWRPYLKKLVRFVANLAPRKKLKSLCHYIIFRREGGANNDTMESYVHRYKKSEDDTTHTHTPRIAHKKENPLPGAGVIPTGLAFCSIQSYCLHAVKKCI